VRRSVYCTASFSGCSRRRTELPIIYADFRLDYKFATLPHLAFAERTRFPAICPHRLPFGQSLFLSSHGSVSLSLRCPMLPKFSLSVFQLEEPGLAKNLGVRLFRRQSRRVSKRRGNMSMAILTRRRLAPNSEATKFRVAPGQRSSHTAVRSTRLKLAVSEL
jgi:hypothetical protein